MAKPTFENEGVVKLGVARSAREQEDISEMSKFQKAVVEPIVQGKSTMAIGPSGSGRSSMVAIGACHIADGTSNSVQVIVVTPNFNLALEMAAKINLFGRYGKVRAWAVGGKGKFREDRNLLTYSGVSCVQVLVGVPASISMMMKGRQKFNTTRHLVLFVDDAEEIERRHLEKSFRTMLHHLRTTKQDVSQMVVFCSSYPENIMKQAKEYDWCTLDFLELNVEGSVNPAVDHLLMDITHERTKFEKLCSQLVNYNKAIIFCNKKEKVNKLVEQLSACGIVEHVFVHGDLKMKDRDMAIHSFRWNKVKYLVSTDLQFQAQSPCVICYDTSNEVSVYLQRLSHVNQFGSSMNIISMVKPTDLKFITNIQKGYPGIKSRMRNLTE